MWASGKGSEKLEEHPKYCSPPSPSRTRAGVSSPRTSAPRRRARAGRTRASSPTRGGCSNRGRPPGRPTSAGDALPGSPTDQFQNCVRSPHNVDVAASWRSVRKKPKSSKAGGGCARSSYFNVFEQVRESHNFVSVTISKLATPRQATSSAWSHMRNSAPANALAGLLRLERVPAHEGRQRRRVVVLRAVGARDGGAEQLRIPETCTNRGRKAEQSAEIIANFWK